MSCDQKFLRGESQVALMNVVTGWHVIFPKKTPKEEHRIYDYT